jgi:hypothetical protein
MDVKWRRVGSEIPKMDHALLCKGELSKSPIVAWYDLGSDMFYNCHNFPVKASHFVYILDVFDAINENGVHE